MSDPRRSDGTVGPTGRLVETLTSHAVFVLDGDGTIETWPAPAADLYGYDAAAMLGEHAGGLLAHDHGSDTADDIAAVLESARTGAVTHEEWHERADGSVFWGTLTLSPLDDRDGFAAVCQDTTTQKEYQQMLERQNDRLKEFTDILVHDLRNPLNAIDLYLTRYREEGKDRHLDAVDETVDRMSRLVDDLLRVARQGDVVASPEPTDIGAVVDTAWDGTGRPRDRLRYDAVRSVSADPDRLCELFENLLRNAVIHGDPSDDVTDTVDVDESDDVSGTGADGRSVTVQVGPLADGFYVEDDGPGVPEAVGAEIFDHGVTTAPGGSGYGLSVVRTIVNAHGWDIELADSAGGARFEITNVELLD
jgi:PAS domain S-box-containing protein